MSPTMPTDGSCSGGPAFCSSSAISYGTFSIAFGNLKSSVNYELKIPAATDAASAKKN